MTISSTYSPVQYNGNGVTTIFAVPYEFYAASDLVVKSTVILTGVTTTLTITTDYTVSGGSGSTGNVTFVTAPASTVRITIERAIPYTQTQDYQENTAFPAATLETGLDKAVVMAQQAKAAADLALKFPATDPSASRGEIPNSVSRANAILSFDANGVPSAVALASIGDINVSLTSPQTNDALVYNAGVWNNKSIGAITAAATTATPVTTDLIPFADVSDSNNTKKTTIQGILDLVPSSGAFVYLGSATASASAALDFEGYFTSTYDAYVFVLSQVRVATNATNLQIRTSDDAGPYTYDTSGYVGSYIGEFVPTFSTTSGASAGTGLYIAVDCSNASTYNAVSGVINLYQIAGGDRGRIEGKTVFQTSSSKSCRLDIQGTPGSGNAITGVRFMSDSGNLTSGTIRLYGVKKS